MLKALLAGAAVTVAIAASPALAQTILTPYESRPMPAPGGTMPMGPASMAPTVEETLPREPATPAERAQVRRDWNEMAREWEQRQRSGYAPPQGSMGATGAPMGSPAIGPTTYGGYGSDTRIAPSQPTGRAMPQQLPMSGSGLQGLPQEPATPAERAQVRRDWNEMAREWEQRQRSGAMPPVDPGQPPLPYQR